MSIASDTLLREMVQRVSMLEKMVGALKAQLDAQATAIPVMVPRSNRRTKHDSAQVI